MTTQVVNIGKLISRSPDVYGGLPVIAGTDTLVTTIAAMHRDDMEANWIAFWRNLTLAQVYAALAYYSANRDEVEKALEAYKAKIRQHERADRQRRREERARRKNEQA